MTEVSLSTMWSKGRHKHMAEFVKEAHEFGFAQMELNTAITPQRLRELLEIEGLKISSIHAPCPNSITSQGTEASSLSLSSLYEDERREAVEFTRATIELASAVKATVVIIHAGGVELDSNLEDKLYQLYRQGLAGSNDYNETKGKLIDARNFWACPHVDAAKESLRELATFASQKGIMIGLENRFYFREIPSLDEVEQLLAEFSDEPVAYWHDVGHAEVQARLGFTPHREWFSRLGEEIIGVHLHDLRGIKYHHAPGAGNLDWGFIASNVPPDAMRVCEIGEWNNPEDARQAVPFFKSKGILP